MMLELLMCTPFLLTGWMMIPVHSFQADTTNSIRSLSRRLTVNMNPSEIDSDVSAFTLDDSSRQVQDLSSALLKQYDATNLWTASNYVDNVIEDQDLITGAILAFLLAWGASFLQSRRNQNDFILSQQQPPPPPPPSSSTGNTTKMIAEEETDNSTTTLRTKSSTFDDWAEMSRPENYVWYKKKSKSDQSSKAVNSFENPWVLVGLLLLFSPIFSFEFLLTVSRQIFCSGILSPETTDWCAPI